MGSIQIVRGDSARLKAVALDSEELDEQQSRS